MEILECVLYYIKNYIYNGNIIVMIIFILYLFFWNCDFLCKDFCFKILKRNLFFGFF